MKKYLAVLVIMLMGLQTWADGISGGAINYGGGATRLIELNDVALPASYTLGKVLMGDGTKMSFGYLSTAYLSDWGTNTPAQIDAFIASHLDPTPAAIGAAGLASNNNMTGNNTFSGTNSFTIAPTTSATSFGATALIPLSKLTDHIALTNPHGITAGDLGAVTTTGNQSVAGVKTFTSFPIGPASSPTTDYQFATKAYADSIAAGLDVRTAVRAATTASLTLASDLENGDTLDTTVTLATGDRVLVKDQASAENGIYIVAASGAPTRATDYDATAECGKGTFTNVLEGTANANTQWVQTVATPTIGVTTMLFTQLSAPQATTASLGVQKVVNDFRLKYAANRGLALDGADAVVDYDNSSIGIVSNKLAVKATGITNAMLAGSIADSKLLTISTADKVDWAAVNKTGSTLDSIADCDVTDFTANNIAYANGTKLVSGAMTIDMLPGSIPATKLATIATAGKVSGAALTSLSSVPSGAGRLPIANIASGTADGTKFVRDDGTLAAIPGGTSGIASAANGAYEVIASYQASGGSQVSYSGSVNVATPMAQTYFPYIYCDLSKVSTYRTYYVAGGSKSSSLTNTTAQYYKVWFQYSTDGGTNWANLDGSGTGVSDTSALTAEGGFVGTSWYSTKPWYGSSWVTIDPSAQTLVLLRAVNARITGSTTSQYIYLFKMGIITQSAAGATVDTGGVDTGILMANGTGGASIQHSAATVDASGTMVIPNGQSVTVDGAKVYPAWRTVLASKYTATPASTSSITMSDTTNLYVGQPLRYTYGGTAYYGRVKTVTSNTSIAVQGAPLDTGVALTKLEFGDSRLLIQAVVVIPGAYAASTGDKLASVGKTYFKWQGATAYLVYFSGVQNTAAGTTNPKINVTIGGSAVSTADSNNGIQLSTAGTWVANSDVATNTSNYDIANGDAVEINCTGASNATGDAKDLTVNLVFVAGDL